MITQIEGKFNYIKRKTKKTQILLADTLRPYNHFINSIRYRYNGRNGKVPHYVINKRGEVFSLFPTEYYSDYVDSKSTIVICLENLGWLQKSTLAPMYVNWIGDVYRGEPHCSKWKERFFWDVYTEDQITSLIALTVLLSEKHNIPKKFINTTAAIVSPTKYKGILSRFSFSTIYSDISPAFDVKLFENLLINEKKDKRISTDENYVENNSSDKRAE